MTKLREIVGIQRRYMRSINLERDFGDPVALEGYVPTPKGVDALRRIVHAAETRQRGCAWTVSSPYGTGKSAFALFLASALAARESKLRADVDRLLKGHGVVEMPVRGLVPAIAAAQREPLANVVVRALHRGIELAWSGRKQPASASLVNRLRGTLVAGVPVTAADVLAAIKAVAQDSESGVVLVIDELGKVLEYAAHHPVREDLYLLQQIAELPQIDGKPVLTVLLLHRSFADYTLPMRASDRAEWAKVQGRFEDIPYSDGPGQMVRLVCQAIEHRETHGLAAALDAWSTAWTDALASTPVEDMLLDRAAIRSLYPLHPLTALALPIICTKYAQNDRSLFSFLTSWEAHGFNWFLAETPWHEEPLATLMPYHLYDYFVETARLTAVARPDFQRWSEVQARVSEASAFKPSLAKVVKTVGLFNLVAMSGSLRASRTLVAHALADTPAEVESWNDIIDEAIEHRLVTWRRQADELRIWEGSDFDVEAALGEIRATVTESLPQLLDSLAPLAPIVARRHSYESGTLRYYERRYLDDPAELARLSPQDATSDGILVHWLGELPAGDLLPGLDGVGVPLLVAGAAGLERLRAAVCEVVALERLAEQAPQLHSDGIARREVQQRRAIARNFLDAEIRRSCGFSDETVVLDGTKRHVIRSVQALNALLSRQCDEVYHAGPKLWTELLNRRELTTQGSKARRELIEAMLTSAGEPGLGLEGYGPEVSMAKSMLEATGLYAERGGHWSFGPPGPALNGAYRAVEAFVETAVSAPCSVDELFARLRRPPFGMKSGPLPVLLAAYLVAHGSEVGFYQDGSFVPQLGAEHFELLVKHPGRFALKSFQLRGPRGAVCKAMAAALGRPDAVVTIVRELLVRSRRWPGFTRGTRMHVPEDALRVRDALLAAREPDLLLFESLPRALDLEPIPGVGDLSEERVATYVAKLRDALSALEDAYPALLRRSVDILAETFTFPRALPELRAAFRERGNAVLTRLEVTATHSRHADAPLKRFLSAAADATANDQVWAEAALMVALDRPVDTWTDGDAGGLAHRLGELARRFRGLEALESKVAADPRPGKAARRITLANIDGLEIERVVWIDPERQPALDRMVETTLADASLASDRALQEAFVATLMERVFGVIPGGEETHP